MYLSLSVPTDCVLHAIVNLVMLEIIFKLCTVQVMQRIEQWFLETGKAKFSSHVVYWDNPSKYFKNCKTKSLILDFATVGHLCKTTLYSCNDFLVQNLDRTYI